MPGFVPGGHCWIRAAASNVIALIGKCRDTSSKQGTLKIWREDDN